MKGKLQFKSIRARLTFWLFLVSILPLLFVSATVYNQRVKSIKEEAFRKLAAIRDLKAEQLNDWIDGKIGNVSTISEDYEMRTLGKVFNRKNLSEDDLYIIKRASVLLNSYIKNFTEYHEIFIVNPISGRVELSTDKSSIGLDKSKYLYFTEPIRTGEIYIHDIYYSKTVNKPAMTFSVPINSITSDKDTGSILVARVDLTSSLYDMLLHRTGMGKTGETLIVNQDAVALNELRWYEHAPLKLKISAKPAVMASKGNVGITETTDYRDEEVLAAYTYIPRTKWGFVSKQDLKEVYSPIRQMMQSILILLLISAVVVYMLATFLARTFARPVLELTEVSRRIREGDLTARNTYMGPDELGYLAQSINKMADAIKSQITIQEHNADISNTMVSATEMEGFGKELLIRLIEVTGSNLGAFYILGEDGSRFEHLTSIGASRELLEPFDASILEGEFGNALSTKKISHIREMPDDTVFKFKTFAGTVAPREIITIPVLLKDRVMAVISVASLTTYSADSLEALNQVWTGINIAFSNLLANEGTRKLADELGAKNQELNAQSEELQALNEELQQQSKELAEQNFELDAQRREVEEANRLKSEFLSNMSHELRTPLNSVMALSRVLIMQAKDKLTEEEGNYLEIIERNGKQLLSLINDILDLSKIEAGRMDINIKPFSVKSTISTLIESLSPLADEKQIKITEKISEDLPDIESDEARVHQILQNIIGNAVKFTEEGKVTVSAVREEDKVSIAIEDTGIGIAKGKLSHIFDEFRQVDGSTSRQFEGTGLGLTIAKKTVAILGGSISVESKTGKGTTFTVTLPVKWKGEKFYSETAIIKPPLEKEMEKKTVLIVDDEPNVRTLFSEYLLEAGYNIITASSGKEALDLAENQKPFAITLDVIMPEMDGWEVLEQLKKNPDTKNIPVIIISVTEDSQTGFALGAVGHLNKPVDRKALIAELNKVGKPGIKSIMVVDDSEIDRNEIVRIVEKEGLNALSVDSGDKCLGLIKESMPDVLVLDLMMPGMDGFEVLEKIRSNPETKNLPVIVVTAKDLTLEDRERLIGNVSSVLSKNDTILTDLLEATC